jgi:hypothetical protein
MKIKVHIERLVLEKLPFTTLQVPLIQRAVEKELTYLLKAAGLSRDIRRSGALPHVRAGSVQLGKENSPSKLGQQIAKAVHEGIGNSKCAGGR